MDELFSYWPLIFLVFVILSRIMRAIRNRQQNSKIKNNNFDDDNRKSTADSNEVQRDNGFDYKVDEEFQPITDESTEKYKEKRDKEDKKNTQKIHVKKMKKKGENNLFKNKEDLVRGIIMKEVLDNPRYKE